MKKPRNPFRLRAAENIESDITFLRLFGPVMLDVLVGTDTWESVCFLRGAPGGGKTSLMRLFTPSSLLALHAQRAVEDCKDLYQRVQDFGAIGDDGPHLLGIMLSCGRNYATLADVDCDEAQRGRLLFALLDARLILAALRGALTLKRLEYPGDLHRLQVALPRDAALPVGLRLPCTGVDVYDWAVQLEASVCDAIDSFGPIADAPLSGHDTLISLSLMVPGWLTIDGQPVAERTLVMLDDVHKLTPRQRDALVQDVIERRAPLGVWIAERFEALNTDELLASGALEGRDHGGVIPLEGFWRQPGKRFEKLIANIGDRRARSADSDIDAFGTHLLGSLDGMEWQDRLSHITDVVMGRVRAQAGEQPRYRAWLDATETTEGTPRERALTWRMLQILIERENRKSQLSFDLWPLDSDELIHKSSSSVKAAAELFLAREFDLPYYYSMGALSSSASSNIEQFLSLAGSAFEEIISADVIGESLYLTPLRQHAILKDAVRKRWLDIPRGVRDGRRVQNFLEAVGHFAQSVTYQPNAPYAPGVTGIAISMRDRGKLRDVEYRRTHPAHAELAHVLSLALANNLLEPVLDHRNKGDRWMIFYLNRSLCVHFDLPLQYGGWREKSLQELSRWTEHGVKALKRDDRLLA